MARCYAIYSSNFCNLAENILDGTERDVAEVDNKSGIDTCHLQHENVHRISGFVMLNINFGDYGIKHR